MALSILLTTLLAFEAEPSATDLMVELTRALCLGEQDRVATASRLVPASWELVEARDERNRTYGSDAPMRAHDRSYRTWRGRVRGGTAWIDAFEFDFHDPAAADISNATFGVAPDTLVDFDDYQRRAGVTMRPSGGRIDGSRPRAVFIRGDRRTELPPHDYRWLQHYTLDHATQGEPVEITGRHFIGGEGFPRQSFDVSCGTVHRYR